MCNGVSHSEYYFQQHPYLEDKIAFFLHHSLPETHATKMNYSNNVHKFPHTHIMPFDLP